jgi:hypothetical protein
MLLSYLAGARSVASNAAMRDLGLRLMLSLLGLVIALKLAG